MPVGDKLCRSLSLSPLLDMHRRYCEHRLYHSQRHLISKHFTIASLIKRLLSALKPRSNNMAWRCSGRTNAELVDNLFEAGIIKSERIRQAMKATDRKVGWFLLALMCSGCVRRYPFGQRSCGACIMDDGPSWSCIELISILSFLFFFLLRSLLFPILHLPS